MAQLLTEQTAFFNLPMAIQRLNPRPLDSTSVWSSYEDAHIYAQNGATSHVGQLLSVVETIDGVSTSRVYVIQNPEGELKRLDIFDLSQDGSFVIDSDMTINGWAKFNNGIYLNNGKSSIFVQTNEDGVLIIDGPISTNGFLTAINGFSLGVGGKELFASKTDEENNSFVNFTADLNITADYGLKLNDCYIIKQKNDNIVSISSPNKIMNLGDDKTTDISLQADIFNDNNDLKLISRFGDGYFPNSFKASYGKGSVLINTYKNNDSNTNEGVLISKKLTFETEIGPSFNAVEGKLNFEAPFYYNDNSNGNNIQKNAPKITTLSYKESDSLYVALNALSSTLLFSTEADFYEFDKPIEGKISLGIANSKTRITDGQLFFDDNVYLIALSDGIKHYGNDYFTGAISSVSFSSGFAGSGWQIARNATTGNIVGTFDELVIRKKMRVYELEVQELSTTNGALWVSDNCSGDTVILIE